MKCPTGGFRVSFEAIGRGKAEPRGPRLHPGSFFDTRRTTPREGGVRRSLVVEQHWVGYDTVSPELGRDTSQIRLSYS
jgi:hypothetical protein